MKIELFKGIDALNLKDNESIDLKIQKTGDEYAVLVIPRMEGHKTDIIVSGTSEELDENLIAEILKPVEKIRGLKSNADATEIAEDKSENDDSEKSTPAGKKGKTAAGKASKKEKNPDNKNTSDDSAEKKVVEDKAEIERLAKEQLERNKAEAEKHLADAKQAHADARWIDKDRAYQKAAALLPDDAALQKEFEEVTKYTNALIRAEILIPRDQWEKEVENGVQS